MWLRSIRALAVALAGFINVLDPEVIVIGGGIAAYKCLELIRRLRDRGAQVGAILTEAGGHFVTPLSVSSLTGEKIYQELFDLTALDSPQSLPHAPGNQRSKRRRSDQRSLGARVIPFE